MCRRHGEGVEEAWKTRAFGQSLRKLRRFRQLAATRVSVVVRPCVAAAGHVGFTLEDTCAVLDGFCGR
jgi:hypothetical protein